MKRRKNSVIPIGQSLQLCRYIREPCGAAHGKSLISLEVTVQLLWRLTWPTASEMPNRQNQCRDLNQTSHKEWESQAEVARWSIGYECQQARPCQRCQYSHHAVER